MSVRSSNTGAVQRREEHEDGGAPVDAQNLAQRISISMVSDGNVVCSPPDFDPVFQDSATSDPRAVVLDDQALMDDLLMQSQDW